MAGYRAPAAPPRSLSTLKEQNSQMRLKLTIEVEVEIQLEVEVAVEVAVEVEVHVDFEMEVEAGFEGKQKRYKSYIQIAERGACGFWL